MAGLEGIDASTMEIIDALGAVRSIYDFEDHIARPLVRHADRIPVARMDGDSGDRVLDRVRFGMPGFQGRLITNARDDKLTTARTWNALFGKPDHHCLTAVSYVLERNPKTKESFRIQRRDGGMIVAPGLCAVRHFKFSSTGNEYDDMAHVQVTADANQFIGKIHDRFVIDLANAKDRDAWMNADRDECARLLQPAPDEAYEMVPVSGDVWKRGEAAGSAEPIGKPVVWDG